MEKKLEEYKCDVEIRNSHHLYIGEMINSILH